MKNSKKTQKIKPLTLEVEKSLWEKFKHMTPRTLTLNDAIVKLIEREVGK